MTLVHMTHTASSRIIINPVYSGANSRVAAPIRVDLLKVLAETEEEEKTEESADRPCVFLLRRNCAFFAGRIF